MFKLLALSMVVLFSRMGAGQDGEPDVDWPAGVSPLDSLSFWSDDQEVPEDPSAKCCLPKTWTATLFTEVRREGGKPREEDDVDFEKGGRGRGGRTLRFAETVYVDENNKRIAQDVTIPHRRNATKVSYIVLFRANNTATLYAFSKTVKKCFKKQLKDAQFRPMCLPANSTLLATFNLGGGSTVLKTQSWGFLVRDRRVFIAGNVILAPSSCTPILAGERAVTRPRTADDISVDKKPKRPEVVTVGALYTNFASRIPDPSVFTPPSYCNDADDTLIFDPDVDFTTLVQRFVTSP